MWESQKSYFQRKEACYYLEMNAVRKSEPKSYIGDILTCLNAVLLIAPYLSHGCSCKNI